MGMGISLVLGALLGSANGPTAGSEAEQMFRQKCQSCHVAPDARFEVDRAWLDQVNRTA